MDNIKPISFITFLSQFDMMTKDAIIATENRLERLSLHKKHLLLKRGNVCNYLYFIEKGLARNFYMQDKTDLTNDIVLEGELLVSFDSFISRQPSNESLELLEDCEITALHYDDLQELYRQFPIMERVGRLIAEYNFNSLVTRNYQLKFLSATERYEHFFKTKVELVRRAPIGVIASFLGMSIETLSRIRSKVG